MGKVNFEREEGFIVLKHGRKVNMARTTTQEDQNIINVRGHHLPVISASFRKKLGELYLEQCGALIQRFGDSIEINPEKLYCFVQRWIEESKRIYHDKKDVRIVAGEPDFICDLCPTRRDSCFKSSFQIIGDRSIAKKYGLEVGEKYSLAEIFKETLS